MPALNLNLVVSSHVEFFAQQYPHFSHTGIMLRALTQLAGKQPKLCGGWSCGARMAFHSARSLLSDGDDGGAISEADLRPLAEVSPLTKLSLAHLDGRTNRTL
jgi:hypothetical protein